MPRFFGTDGVRGIANEELTPDLATRLGRAGADFYRGGERPARVVIGRDTRVSGQMLEAALSVGLMSAGAHVIQVGILPTAAIAYLTLLFDADGGAVISASHNPGEHNGIKFFDGTGFKLSAEQEEDFESRIDSPRHPQVALGREIGTGKTLENAAELYIDYLIGTISGDLSGLSVLVDCANGAANTVCPAVFERLGAKVTVIGDDPDGFNINDDCGSTHPERLQESVAQAGVDLGLAFDGDADRVIAVDSSGEIVDGDFIMAICAVHYRNQGNLPKDSMVTTVMTNMGFYVALEKAGISVLKTQVGDRFVLELMREKGISLGGEQSGHIIFLNDSTTGDGILTGIKLMSIVKETGKPLSELRQIMQRMPQVLLNIEVGDKDKFAGLTKVSEEIERAERELDGRGRVLVRASGTENLVRVMVEAEEISQAEEIAHSLADLIKAELTALMGSS
ncbi:MAG: phosphoglucosamine mutase [Terriglobia bacterium]